MLTKLETMERHYLELEQVLADPELYADQEKYRKIAKSHADLQPIISAYRHYQNLLRQQHENNDLLQDPDPEIKNMAQEELQAIAEELPRLEQEIRIMLLPPDPLDEKNIVLEIRAGTGGEEAALFAGDCSECIAVMPN